MNISDLMDTTAILTLAEHVPAFVLMATGALGGSDSGYKIPRSLRFRSGATAYLARTLPGTITSRKAFTISFECKRGALGTQQVLLNVNGASSNYAVLQFDVTTDCLNWHEYGASSYNLRRTTTRVFRDPNAHLHVVIAFDSNQGTAANRARMYINGVEETSFTSVDPSSGYDSLMNVASAVQNVGRFTSSGSHFDGLISNLHYVDGQQLTASNFGQFDPSTGAWVPKAYTGSYGLAGGKWLFSDNSAATAVAIGADSSGNGNNWTPNNISVTAGVTNDSLVDTPTNYGSDTGAGGEVRGNYCTWNPIGNSRGHTYSESNLKIASTTKCTAVASWFITSGKWWWEAIGSGYAGAIVLGGGENWGGSLSSSGSKGIGYWEAGGIYWDGGAAAGSGAAYNNSTDVVSVALDMDAVPPTVEFFKNGVTQYKATSGSGTVPNFSAGVFPAFNDGNTAAEAVQANFGQRPFAYAAPTGFKALCTQNLPDPAIKKPLECFDVVSWIGNATGARTISGSNFQPDLVWAKNRTSADHHQIYDSTRGVGKRLQSSDASAEVTNSANGYVSAFNSNGFSTTPGTTDNSWFNGNSQSMIAWLWKKSALAGIDIVSFTGTGASQLVNHSLGVVPSMILVKDRAGANAWVVGHSRLNDGSSPWNYYTVLNTNAAQAASSSPWNNTAPTSTQFTVGANAVNGNAQIAYLFAEVPGFSKFGSYIGSGSTDGFLVPCGFRPRFVLTKRFDSTGDWTIHDSARDVYNPTTLDLYPYLNNAESSGAVIDFLSNGFKFRGATPYYNNISGGKYIFMAFAEVPFKYARAR